MRADWELHLERWIQAGIVDSSTAGLIRDWEADRSRSRSIRWPTAVALAFGALLIGAGVLLFVSAHWDDLSPLQRLSLVLLLTAVFHVAGAAVASRFAAMSVALHAAGTLALGAGIGLAGQIYHLSTHWPAGIMLWALGAALVWLLLRHWPQAALVAVLVPFWLGSEWEFFSGHTQTSFMYPVAIGICTLSLAYLGGRTGPHDSATRKALGRIGGIFVLPAALGIAVERWGSAPDWHPQALAWIVALGGPMLVAFGLRRFDLLWNAAAVLWCLVLARINFVAHDTWAVYLWSAFGAGGLIFWGVRESRPERVNLGIIGFALTLLIFYFSDVMDKLGRSASLMLLGILFLGGGWLLERTRRRLIAGIHEAA